MRHVSLLGSLGLASTVMAGGVAFGHAHLTAPMPRVQTTDPVGPGYITPASAAAGKATGPCGNGATFSTAGTPHATLTQGVPFDVTFLETIDHPGSYRIALNATGNGVGPAMEILVAAHPDLGGAVPAGGRPYTAPITIPAAVPDGTYVLQLIQVMTEGAVDTYYYSCADIVIGEAAALPDGGGEVPDGGGAGGADSAPAAAADAAMGGGGDGAPPGLCSYAGRSGSKPGLGMGLALFMAAALIWRRRR